MKILVTIVMPVYFERESVEETLDWIEREVVTPHEILVVYDEDDDPTVAIVKRVIARGGTNIKLVKNRGRGVVPAMQTGFAQAKGEASTVIAADGTDDPSVVEQMYELICEGYGIVSTTRYAKGGRLVAPVSVKSAISRVANLLSPTLTGIQLTDLTYAYKMYDKKLLDTIDIESTGGFEYAMELTIKAVYNGARITEVPVVSVDRTRGESKFVLKQWLVGYLKWYTLAIWWRVKRAVIGN